MLSVEKRPHEVVKDERYEMFVVTIDGKALEPQNYAAAAERVKEALCHGLHSGNTGGNSNPTAPRFVTIEKVVIEEKRTIVQWGADPGAVFLLRGQVVGGDDDG